MKFASALVLLTTAFGQDQPGPIVSCGEGLFDLREAKFDPYPIVSGKPVSVTTIGNLNTTIAKGAKTEITLRLGIVTVHRETNDFCGQSAAAGNPCPLLPGEQNIVVTQSVPDSAPG